MKTIDLDIADFSDAEEAKWWLEPGEEVERALVNALTSPTHERQPLHTAAQEALPRAG